jgi:hypothetical protein
MGRVPLPVIKAGDDARVLLARYRSSLIQANVKLEVADGCLATLIEAYARAR